MPTSQPFAKRRRCGFIGVALIGILNLVGCSQTLHVEPAEDSNNPRCADVTVRLPDSLGTYGREWTDGQATGAWGSKPAVMLRCGVAVPAPTDLVCQTIYGIDWIIFAQEKDVQQMVTYGRDPAIQVVISRDAGLDFADTLEDLGKSIKAGLSVPSGQCS